MDRSRIISYFFIFFVSARTVAIDGARVRRVIEGSPLLDIKTTDYLSTRYFVAIGSGHNCDTPIPDFVSELIGKPKDTEVTFINSWGSHLVGRICAPKPGHLLCTGSLLTPFLVQTACHCLASFEERGEDDFHRGVKHNAQEVGFTVHPARRLVEEILTNEGVFCRDFIIHPKCGEDGVRLIYDYALILLYSSFDPYQTFYAPIYPVADLAKMWLDTMAKEKVCLNIGFGRYKWLEGKPYEEDNARSDILRHGWSRAINYKECYQKFGGPYIKNYTERSSFLCTVSLTYRPKQREQKSGKGDSGGPVTCDNYYVGIVAEGRYFYRGEYKTVTFTLQPQVGYDKRMSTAFSAYENSIEYRADMSYNIYDLYGPEDPLKDFRVSAPPFKVYFVTIGSGHNCEQALPDTSGNSNFATFGSDVRICAPHPEHLLCTGSLLSPFLVQTACHCLATFRKRGNSEVLDGVKRNAIEVGYTVHPARNHLDQVLKNQGEFCKGFFVHPQCTEESGTLLHDYGLIVLLYSFSFQTFYAPIYPLPNLAKMWLEAMAEAKVCLNIGFGRYKLVAGGKPYEEFIGRSSVLRHGWSRAINYKQCYEKFRGRLLTNYTSRATFLCTESLPYRPQQEALKSGRGDSGGPVTCDNQYVGIATESRYYQRGANNSAPFLLDKLAGYDKHMSTAFSIYENSIEYRAEMSYRMYKLYSEPDDPLKYFRVEQPKIKIYDNIGGKSSSCALFIKTTSYIDFLIAVTLIITFNQ
ncbi:hypothetical protein GE061_013099 [Apolygus lucorum]|uniref:Peptidase S1 domain-containing protein n=1 Tax=Apolygus lucorum TaxID=248454 RepID=A0A8S9XVF4_APOLU|nr:hypothetical protein GE061_013099 [Apolygus lucorum]